MDFFSSETDSGPDSGPDSGADSGADSVFEKKKEELFSRLEAKLSHEFYEENVKPLKASYGRWADTTNQSDAYLKPLEKLVDDGVDESILDRLTLSNISYYDKLRNELSDEEFFKYWDLFGDRIVEKVQFRGLNNFQIQLKKESLDSYLEYTKSLPDWFNALGNWPYLSALSVIKMIRNGACLANFSFIDSQREPYTLHDESNNIIAYSVFYKFYNSINFATPMTLKAIHSVMDNMDYGKLLWITIYFNNKKQKIPIYAFLKDSYELKCNERAICTSIGGDDTNLIINLETISFEGKVGHGTYQFDLDINLDEKDPIEKLVADFNPELVDYWQMPFIINDVENGYDWSLVKEGKYYKAINLYHGKESCHESIIRALRDLGLPFEKGHYNTIIFGDCSTVSIYDSLKDIRGFVELLKEKGFPLNCEYRWCNENE